MTAEKQITSDDVALLLSHRKIELQEIHHDALQQIALVMSGEASPAVIEAVDAHLATCRDCREALLMLHPMTETREVDQAVIPFSPNPKRFSGTTRMAVSFAAAILVAGALFAWWWPTPTSPVVPSHTTQLSPKGGDLISAVVRRENRLLHARHLMSLKPGDQLGFFYSAGRPGYLALLTRDSTGAVFVQFPGEGHQSSPVSAGVDVSLPDGAMVDTVSECEWIIGVFSDTALPLDALRESVENAKETDTDCQLQLEIPEVRSLEILSFRKERDQ